MAFSASARMWDKLFKAALVLRQRWKTRLWSQLGQTSTSFLFFSPDSHLSNTLSFIQFISFE
jgi:hypothetical protein